MFPAVGCLDALRGGKVRPERSRGLAPEGAQLGSHLQGYWRKKNVFSLMASPLR